MKYRIIKHDKFNWAIEEYQTGGEEITRGRYVGQKTKAVWKPANLFYSSLKDAAHGLLDRAAGDALLSGEANNILDAISVAQKKVEEALKST